MCVIFYVAKEKPTEEMIEKAYAQNDDGGGIAWREADKKGTRYVRWQKGLDLAGVKEMVAKLTPPFTVHFRIASIGGVRASLTHPFPVDKDASLALEGKTNGHVLFHNGHWKDWADYSRNAAVMSNTKIPTGRWSDSRAMAWLCSIYGNGFMEFLPDQKGVVFGPNDAELFLGPGWTKINNIWCSNDYFMKARGVQMGFTTLDKDYCKFPHCIVKTNLDKEGYCVQHVGGKDKYTGQANGNTIDNKGSGGSSTPFSQGRVISLAVAERLHRETSKDGQRKLSKNKIKKIRQWWKDISNPKKKEKALKGLEGMTLKVFGTGRLT